jgi:predicted ATPase
VRHVIEVGGLPAGAFAQFARALFVPGCELTAAQLEAAHDALGANPGNLLEALDSLVQAGVMRGEPGRYRDLPADVEIRPALPLLQRLRRRAASLPKEVSFVLAAAATLGDSFPIDDLVKLTGSPPLQVLAAISVFQGRIVRAEGGRVAFRHRDYRRVLREHLPLAARRRLHRAAAWVLEDRGAQPLQVGLHLSLAREHQAAILPLLTGLERLVDAGSRHATLRVVQRLGLHLSAVPDTEANAEARQRFHLLAGRSYAANHRQAEATASFTAVLRTPSGDAATRLQARIELASLCLYAGRQLAGLLLLEAALDEGATARGPRVKRLAVRALLLGARHLGDMGHPEDALARLAAARRLAARADTRLAGQLLLEHAHLQHAQDHFATALKSLHRAESNFAAVADVAGLMRVHINRGRTLLAIGDTEGAAAACAAAVELAERLSDPGGRGRARLTLGELHALRRDRDAARDHLLAAMVDAAAAGDAASGALAAIHLAALGILTPALERAAEVDVPAVRVAWLLLQARRSEEEGGPAAAEPFLHQALQIDRTVYLPFHLHLALLRGTGQETRARKHVEYVAARVPAGSPRRRFLRFAQSEAALPEP